MWELFTILLGMGGLLAWFLFTLWLGHKWAQAMYEGPLWSFPLWPPLVTVIAGFIIPLTALYLVWQ